MVVSLAVAACGSSGTDLQWPLSGGSRLQPLWFVTPDGQKAAIAADGWIDSQLDIPCTPSLDADETGRCFPRTEAGTSSQVAEFSDPACSMPAIFDGELPPNPCSSLDNPLATGWAFGPTRDLVPITGALRNATSYHRDGSGACVAYSTADGYSIGAAVPASTFVGFGAPAPVGSGRLRTMVRVADDGARAVTGLWDDARGVACGVGDPGDGVTRCLPKVPDALFALDAACTQSVATALGATSSDPAPVIASVQTGTLTHYYAVANELTPTTLYYLNGTTCELYPYPPPSGTYWALGAEIPLDEFASVHDVTLTRGRIVEHGWADDHGALVARLARLHDTVLDVDVTPLYIDQATVVLGPVDWSPAGLYADAVCTQLLVEATAQPHVATTDGNGPTGCYVRHTFAVGGQVTPSKVFLLNGTVCAPATLPTDSLFEVDAELPPSTFVPLAFGN
jgi:hypothetical protein